MKHEITEKDQKVQFLESEKLYLIERFNKQETLNADVLKIANDLNIRIQDANNIAGTLSNRLKGAKVITSECKLDKEFLNSWNSGK